MIREIDFSLSIYHFYEYHTIPVRTARNSRTGMQIVMVTTLIPPRAKF